MKLLTLLCACLFITTGTWAYSSDCAKGPEYWCRDVSTAEDCGAVQHCQTTVWNNKKSMTTSETAQMLCNVLVQASSGILADDSSSNSDSIEQFLRQDCSKLPRENNLIEQCEMAVDTYLADILLHIESGTELTQICSIIQGHDRSNVFLPKPKSIGITSNQTCVLCEFIVHMLQTFATGNKTSAELAHILEQICREMPSVLRDECKSFIDTYGPDIIALLVREFDPAKTCELIKICPKSTNVAFLTKPNEQTCGLCDYVSTYLSAGHPIENVCKHFSTENDIKQQCEILVHLYKPNFCSELPLCFDDTLIQPLEQPIGSAQCTLCKYVVNYIDAVIQTNKSEAAIEAALEKVCGILPAPLKAPCVQFVDSYGPILVQLIEKYGTADKVCNALKVCNNGTQEFTPLERVQHIKLGKSTLKAVPCVLCKLIIGYLETATKDNKSAAAIEAALDKVCNVLPGTLKDNCTQFVHKYGPIIALLLAKNATAIEVCDFIKVCNNGTQQIMPRELDSSLKVKPSSINSAQCTLCKYVVNYIDAVIQTNKSEAAIEAALEKVCGILPAPLKAPCVQFVDSYGPILVQLIEKYGTADKVCNALKVCNNGTQEFKPTGLVQMLKSKKSSLKSAECALCKYVVGYIDNVIQNNKSEAAIEAALEKVCTILPAALKDKCVQFVDTYGPVLAQLISKYATPEQVCNALQMCHNGTESIQPVIKHLGQVLKANANPAKITSTLGSTQCILCKYVVNYIDAVIQTNKSEAAIEAALEKVCGILPAPLKAPCVQFVDSYGPILVQLIEKYGTADKVCNALKVCNNGTQTTESITDNIVKSIKKIKDGNECTLCKYILSYINVLIKNNATEIELEKALEVVCGILPSSYHAKCEDFVQTYGPILTELIAELDDPNVVCQWLGLCPKSNHKFIQIPALKTKKLQSLPCNLCEYLVNYLDAIVQSNSTETKFIDALDKACKVLPEQKLKSECQLLVHLYGADLIKFLVEYGDPKAVCQAIGICDK